MKVGRSLKNIASLNRTKLLQVDHLDSRGLHWDEIDCHIKNI